MSIISNITEFRFNLLKTIQNIDSYDKIIVVKDNNPEAVLINIKEYEEKILKTNPLNPVLILSGAKICKEDLIVKSIESINKSKQYFSNIVFVYGKDTYKYRTLFNVNDLRCVENNKSNLPLITSLKCGLSAISNDKNYFILSLLSRPIEEKVYKIIFDNLKKKNKGIILLTKEGKPVHPIAFSIKYKEYFIKTRKELGIPYIVKKFKDDIKKIEINPKAAFSER